MQKARKFRLLINLALIDDFLDDSERMLLVKLAGLEGFSEEDIDGMVEQERTRQGEPQPELGLSYDEKIKVLIDLIKVMKVDGKVFDAEVKYCERVAKRFGFNEKAIGFLSGNVNLDPKNSAALDKIHYRMKKYVRE